MTQVRCNACLKEFFRESCKPIKCADGWTLHIYECTCGAHATVWTPPVNLPDASIDARGSEGDSHD